MKYVLLSLPMARQLFHTRSTFSSEAYTPRAGAPIAASRPSEERFRRKVSVEIRRLASSMLAAPTRRRRHRCRSRRRFRIRHREATAAAGRSLDAFPVRRVLAAKFSPSTLLLFFWHGFCNYPSGTVVYWKFGHVGTR